MDESFTHEANALANGHTKQSPLMQFVNSNSNNNSKTQTTTASSNERFGSNNKKDTDTNISININSNNNNNNNNDNLFSYKNRNRPADDDQSVDHIPSPLPSSNSSVSSQTAPHNDECDTNGQTNHSSPGSPQSSYNSSYGSGSGRNLMNRSSSSITSLVPGGVVTTQNISTVIKPRENNNSLQFVKIQPPELSKKAVEQIRIAQETKISKDKIKEVEEEWQNNLLNWKSKRRQQLTHLVDYVDPNDQQNEVAGGRKIKTFAEMLEQRAKTGNRLGFHLQRYIGFDEEDEGPPLTGAAAATQETLDQVDKSDEATKDCQQDEQQDQEHNETRHSNISRASEVSQSTRSRFSHLDSASPASTYMTTNSGRVDSRCDNESSSTMLTPFDDSSLMVTEQKSGGAVQLNSTLLADSTKSPPPPPSSTTMTNLVRTSSNIKSHQSRLLIETVGTKVNEPILKSEDDSENSAFEDDDEEEEQKHLQRIAFEAKLKAFEKLTKPTTTEPKLIPKRFVKPSSPQPVQFAQSTPSPVPTPTPRQTPAPVKVPAPAPASKPVPPVQVSIPATTVPVSPEAPASLSASSSASIPIPASIPAPPAPPPAPAPVSVSVSKPVMTTSVQMPVTVPAPLSVPVTLPAPVSQPSTVVRIQQPQSFVNNSVPLADSHSGLSQIDIIQNQSSHLRNGPQTKVHQHPQQQQQQQHLNPPPLPPPVTSSSSMTRDTPKKTGHKKLANDDKDRTVLSVSGKKRCSSCKEELGRGAAAFVVESLSLVYHTNCFRCSVCHVNLSNGFRGVDVRVHAGSLHCQNCYSKDGLNYSRV